MIGFLKRHAVQVLRETGHTREDIARLVGVSVRSARRAGVEDVDFTFQTSIRRHLLASYLGSYLFSEARSVVFLGPSGTGKTLLDGVPERGRLIELLGRSYRTPPIERMADAPRRGVSEGASSPPVSEDG